MKYPRKYCVLILVAVVAATVLRLPQLKQRPMHGDEAVNAFKFGDLLEKNFYRYNPSEYHGPTLNYLNLIPAWLSPAEKFAELNEFTLRIVPVFFAVCLVLLLLLLVDGLGAPATITAAVLTAISPAFVFYSRYYIHEMLLVCFTFGVIVCGYRYTQSKNIWWALLTGMFVALCHATKETCIIAFGAMFLALLLILIMQRRQGNSIANNLKAIKSWHIIVAVATAIILSALFYSSFLQNPTGILDSFSSYAIYFNRASQSELHIHPWYYYLKMLLYSRLTVGPVWSEALIILLALAGFIVAMTRKGIAGINSNLLRFVAFYTLIMTILYSAIPYKTPWCLLGFLHGMILLAGVGAVAIVRLAQKRLAQVLIVLVLVVGSAHLAWQACLANFKYYADPANPYVYAHTVKDVFEITRRIQEVAQAHPDGRNMYIQVICPSGDYWPLPWYLRSFPNIGWWSRVDKDAPAAPLIIASPAVGQDLMRKLYELPPPGKRNLYVPLFDSYMQLRPQIELKGFVTKELWDSFQQQKQSVQSNPR